MSSFLHVITVQKNIRLLPAVFGFMFLQQLSIFSDCGFPSKEQTAFKYRPHPVIKLRASYSHLLPTCRINQYLYTIFNQAKEEAPRIVKNFIFKLDRQQISLQPRYFQSLSSAQGYNSANACGDYYVDVYSIFCIGSRCFSFFSGKKSGYFSLKIPILWFGNHAVSSY